MSKSFNEMRKAQDWVLRENASANLNIDELVHTVKEGQALSQEVADVRLKGCRTFRLSPPPGLPLLSSDDHLQQIATESYRGLRTRLLRFQAKTGLRSLVVTSAMAREGKTFTAMNLALCFAQLQDLRILLVDADLRTRCLTHLLGSPPLAGLGDILSGTAQFEESILATDRPNLYFLGAGTATGSPAELYAGSRWKEFMGWSSECFKLIIVDSPPVLPLADFELISAHCDGILAVVRALETQRDILQKAATSMDAKKLLGVVFNGTQNGAQELYYNHYYTGQKKP